MIFSSFGYSLTTYVASTQTKNTYQIINAKEVAKYKDAMSNLCESHSHFDVALMKEHS